jgi:NAD+ synthase (glutamine-hydrolysing)
MRFALAQINPIVGDFKINLSKMTDFIGLARDRQADVVIFPEMALCGYPPEDLLYKGQFLKDARSALKSLARQAKNIVVVSGCVEVQGGKNLFNSAAVLAEQSIQGFYHKENLPNYGVFDERRYFQRGENNPLFMFGRVPVGLNICEDIWMKQGICQRQVKNGTKVLINISGSPYNVGKLTQRENLLKSLARQSSAYILYVNMVGGQDELVFDGGSLAVSPRGRLLAYGRQFDEDLLCVDIEVTGRVKKAEAAVKVIAVSLPSRGRLKPALDRTKAERYPRLERIYRALVLGVRDYVRKNGFQKVLIGLSGGIDSSLVAAVAVEALGAENVVGVTMPSRYTSQGTKSDAKTVAANLGIECLEIPIERIFKNYLDDLAAYFKDRGPDITEENIQARIRGNILMALSNKFGWMVLATGNKSEVAVGYCTLYGDMSGGFAVIKDVPKTKVYELSLFVNSRGRELIPRSVIKRDPSAELRANQRDQDSLPPYEILDAILERYIERHQSFARIARVFDPEVAKKVIRLVDANEYKRRQSPPGIKITSRAFGKDWRLPITNRYQPYGDGF